MVFCNLLRMPARARLAVLAAVVAVAATNPTARAGGGPEGVFLVYNGRSWSSKTIANAYAHLRGIPDRCIFQLDWDGGPYRTDIATFRLRILQPILNEIRARNLTHQIDYIVYSSDFPYEIEFGEEAQGDFTSGSLTGMTYLAQLVHLAMQLEGDNAVYASANANQYFSRVGDDLSQGPTRGFRGSYRWSTSGERTEDEGLSYVLSTMLGFTQGRGNSVDEVLAYLQRSVLADGTHPSGTIYYMRSGDEHRSGVREALGAFEKAAAELEALGVRAEILDGVIPQNRDDVMGTMVGYYRFNWATSGSHILPGAICENFTSFGAVMDPAKTHNQSVASEFLRYGAAGSSGTVIEPYSIPAKFPHPRIHVHYARGCSLAEAYYQSVRAPYQLLILGDPLCRPWADIPQVMAQGVEPGQEVQGDVKIQPMAVTRKGTKIGAFRLFLDGQLMQIAQPGVTAALPTDRLTDGHHEIRIVAVEDSAIETQGSVTVPLMVNNHGHKVDVSVIPEQPSYDWNDRVVIQAEMAGATHLELYHGRERLGRISGDRATFSVTANQVGSGPVRLQVAGIVEGTTSQRVLSRPVVLHLGFPDDVRASDVVPTIP